MKEEKNLDMGYLHLKPEGRICLGEKLSDFSLSVEGALKSDLPWVILDLKGTTYMDSSGLGEILKLFLESRNRKKTLVLTNVPPFLGKVLKSSKLDKIFVIAPDMEGAIAKTRPQ